MDTCMKDMARPLSMSCFWYILVLFFTNAQASFTSSPSEVTPHKTPQVILLCEPQPDNAITTLAIRIKATVNAGAGEGNDKGSRRKRRSQQNSDDRLIRVTITAGNQINILPSNKRFEAKGSMSHPPLLEVTINNPGPLDVGSFDCQFTYLDSSGNVQVANEETQIKEVLELSMETLDKRVKDLEDEVARLKSLGNTASEAKEVSRLVKEDVAALKKENEQLAGTLADLIAKVKTLQAEVTSLSGSAGTISKGSRKEGKDAYQEGLFAVNAKMEEFDNTRIHAMEEKVTKMESRHLAAEERIDHLEDTVTMSLSGKIKRLESFNLQGISQRLEEIETKSMPMALQKSGLCGEIFDKLQDEIKFLTTHVSMSNSEQDRLLQQIQYNTKAIHNAPLPQASELASADNVDHTEVKPLSAPPAEPSQKSIVPVTPAATTTTTPPTSTTTTTTTTTTTATTTIFHPYSGPACYSCGDNSTQEGCTDTTIKRIEHCKESEPYCMTRFYQNSQGRGIYKRCVTYRECYNAHFLTFSACNKSDFVNAPLIQCHFCCTTVLCNDNIKPSRSMFKWK